MSWDGIYANEREYPIFKFGDEVYTSKSFKAISKNKPYIVLDCYQKTTHIWVISLKNDHDKVEEYASYKFQKTKNQIKKEDREKKISWLLETN
jgi:hypothetical protein